MRAIETVEMFAVGTRKLETREAARLYRDALDAIDNLNGWLASPGETSEADFANGGCYVQQDPLRVAIYAQEAAAILKRFVGEKEAAMFRENPRGIVGRYLDDGESPFYAVWYRMCRIDADSREWGQPCFVNHSGTLKPHPNTIPPTRTPNVKPGSASVKDTGSGSMMQDREDEKGGIEK